MHYVIQGADPASWQHLYKTYSKDARQIFHDEKALPGENPAQWRAQTAMSHEQKHAEEGRRQLAGIFAMMDENDVAGD